MAGFELVAVIGCVAIVSFLLGAGAYRFSQTRCPLRRAAKVADAGIPAADPAPTSAEDRQLPLSPPAGEKPGSGIPWLMSLMDRVEGDLGWHTYRLDELNDELQAAERDPKLVLAAATSMMVANQRLQADLSAAQDEIQRQRQRLETLSAEARTDQLTGLPNRRSFNEELSRRFDQWRRHKIPLSLVIIDLDRFKQVNDGYGHSTGDQVLHWAGELVRNALRQMDMAARYGGEEFAAILPGAMLHDAVKVAERIRQAIAAAPFQNDDRVLSLSVSIGVASALAGDDTARLIERSDEALYAAKDHGRNCVFVQTGDHCVSAAPDRHLVRAAADLVETAVAVIG
jgi:diguanylate cyclase